jgi:hypothetical protein
VVIAPIQDEPAVVPAADTSMKTPRDDVSGATCARGVIDGVRAQKEAKTDDAGKAGKEEKVADKVNDDDDDKK